MDTGEAYEHKGEKTLVEAGKEIKEIVESGWMAGNTQKIEEGGKQWAMYMKVYKVGTLVLVNGK